MKVILVAEMVVLVTNYKVWALNMCMFPLNAPTKMKLPKAFSEVGSYPIYGDYFITLFVNATSLVDTPTIL